MRSIKFPRPLRHVIGAAVGCMGAMVLMSAPALAGGPQCGPRYIAHNIQEAVLALKAAQYCKRADLPYTAAEASQRVDSLRCGDSSSLLIDELLMNFDQQYKTILVRDPQHIICERAVQISLHASD